MTVRKTDMDKYYRKGVFEHFSKDCKCSISMTKRVDVTRLREVSKNTNTKFYVNFLYLLCRALNSRDDYKMFYDWKTNDVLCFDKINPTQYVFHEDTETCTPVYTVYYEDYDMFYSECVKDIEKSKQTREYGLDMANHPNWFDASYLPWVSYDSMNVELPDGHLYFQPIVNWGKYREEGEKYMLPLSVRLNHAIADGYLLSQVYVTLEKEIAKFCDERGVQ